MAIGFGYKSYLGFGTEATYGTPVTRTNFLEMNSESFAKEDDVVEGNSTYSLADKDQNFFQGQLKAGGSFEFDARVQGWERIAKCAFGGVTTTAMGSVAAQGSQHAFAMTDTLPAGLSMEVNRDTAAFLYEGGKVNQITFNGDNSGILTISADMIFETEGTVAASTPTFSSAKYYNFSQCALTVAGGTRAVTGFSVSLNNNLKEDRYHLGSRLRKEPVRNGRVEVTGNVDMEFDALTDWTTFQTAGTGAIQAVYTGDIINGTIANKLTLNVPYARLQKVAPTVGDSGLISVSIPFKGYAQGTTAATMPLSLTLINLTNGTDI